MKDKRNWRDLKWLVYQSSLYSHRDKQRVAVLSSNRDRDSDLGKKRIIMSPSPVAAAPPPRLLAYAPDPIIGESPTRLAKETSYTRDCRLQAQVIMNCFVNFQRTLQKGYSFLIIISQCNFQGQISLL